jgi:flagellar biosynthesis protein FlhG
MDVAMTDQAQGLRRQTQPAPPRLPAIAVTGGKGGVGKTSTAVNLACLLAKAGLPPILVDTDLGLANADVMLGVDPQATLADVVLGGRPIEGIVTDTPYGFGLVPAASGVDALANLSQQDLNRLLLGLERLARIRRPLVIDTPAGIGREVIAACRAARIVAVVLTPEPTSLADAYAVIKLVEQAEPGHDLRIIVNMARDQQDGAATFARIRAVAQKHLGRDLELLGVVPRDDKVSDAIRRRRPLATGVETPALTALRGIAARLKGVDWEQGR